MVMKFNQEFEAYNAHKPAILAEAKKITADMKNKDVKAMVESGNIPEIVALIAYLNRLK